MAPSEPAAEGRRRFAAAVSALQEELDWERLGQVYCHEGGEGFFPPSQREAILEAGLRITADLGQALEELSPEGPGRSLYFGAAVAELVPILFESLVAGRTVVWRNRPGAEAEELNRALAAVASRLDLALPCVEVEGPLPGGPFDHLWCVSVLTDPDVFPALHDELYGRRGGALAAGGGDAQAERREALGIAGELLGVGVFPALLTTSDEELALFEEVSSARDLRLEVPPSGRLSPIVGDVVRLSWLKPV